MYRLVSIEESKDFIREHEQKLFLSLLYDLGKGRQLHKKRLTKKEALEAVDSAKTAILNQDKTFSVLSLYSVLQKNEKEIKLEGTEQKLIIVELNENLFEK